MTDMTMPPLIQAIGLACEPVTDTATEPAIDRRPIAAAIVTLATRDDGHREISVARHSDARAAEFPLPWLVDRSLVPGAPVIVTPVDAATLVAEAMTQRFWAEPRLAALMREPRLVDPTRMAGVGSIDEAALRHRLGITLPTIEEVDGAQGRTRTSAMTAALGVAVARLMLWAHHAASAAAEPDIFFKTLLPLTAWLADEAERVPPSNRWCDRALSGTPARRSATIANTAARGMQVTPGRPGSRSRTDCSTPDTALTDHASTRPASAGRVVSGARDQRASSLLGRRSVGSF